MTQEHFDEAFDFAASLAEQRRRRDEEERRSDPIYGLPGETPDEWYERRLREVREKNFEPVAAPDVAFPNYEQSSFLRAAAAPGRMVPRFEPKENQKRVADLEQTSRLNRELEALRKLEEVVARSCSTSEVYFALQTVKKARQP
jgi:hypothetical protein